MDVEQILFIIITSITLTMSVMKMKYRFKKAHWQNKSSSENMVKKPTRLKTIIYLINSYTSFNSTVPVVGVISETYLYGGRMLSNYISVSIGYFFAFFILQPFFFGLDKSIKTPYEYLEKRYGGRKSARAAGAFGGFLFYFGFMALHLWAAVTIAVTIIPGLPMWLYFVVIGIFGLCGSVFGGLVQSSKISAVQFVIVYVGFCVAIAVSLTSNPKRTALEQWQLAGQHGQFNFITPKFDFTTRYTIYNQVLSLWIPWTTMHAIFGPSFSRYRSINGKTKSRFILIAHLPAMFIINSTYVIAGICSFIFFFGCDPYNSHEIFNRSQLTAYFFYKSLPIYVPSLAGILFFI